MAGDYLVDRSIATIVGAIGMVLLFICWKSRSRRFEKLAPFGWVMTGFYFFNDVTFYLEHSDPVLSTMSALTLPGAFGIAMWERRVSEEKYQNALLWFRGTVAVAGLPYLLIAHVPVLNVLAIWIVAWQSAALLSFAGGANVTLGDTFANPANGQSVNWNDWDGNRWFLTEEMSEYSFHTELLVNGEPIYINFVLACTAYPVHDNLRWCNLRTRHRLEKESKGFIRGSFFDSHPQSFQKCRFNLAANGIPRVEVDESFNL